MPPKILFGVTGCAQAEAVPHLLGRLRSRHRGGPFEVIVASTEAALQFFDRSVIEERTGRPVFVTHSEATKEFPVPHVNLAEWADTVIVYPATANTVAKCAHGICDSLVSTIVLGARSPVYFGPVMNEAMWENRLTQANLRRLEDAGYHLIPRERTWVRVRATGKRIRTLCCTEESVLSVCERLAQRLAGVEASHLSGGATAGLTNP